MISEKFIVLGVIIQLWGCLVYAKDTLTGKTKPNRVTWTLWALAPLIAFAAMVDEGVGLVSLMTLSVGLGPAMVLAASFVNKKSYWKLRKTDYICGALALAALILWLVFQEGRTAILLSIASDGFAAYPTLRKAFTHPETESVEAYTVAIINSAITLMAIKTWVVAHYAFPIYIFIINVIFVLLIQFKLGKSFRVENG